MVRYDYIADDAMVYRHIITYFKDEIDELQSDLAAMFKFYVEEHSNGDYLLLLENRKPIYEEDIEYDILECIESIGYVRSLRNRFMVVYESITGCQKTNG